MNENEYIILNSYNPSIYFNNDACFHNDKLEIEAFFDDLSIKHKKNIGNALIRKNHDIIYLPIPDFLGTKILIGNIPLNFSTCKIISYKEKLHMKSSLVEKEILLEDKKSRKTFLSIKKILSASMPSIYAIYCRVKPINYNSTITFMPYVNFSNISDQFTKIGTNISNKCGLCTLKHNSSGCGLGVAMKCEVHEGCFKQTSYADMKCSKNKLSYTIKGKADSDKDTTLFKYISVICADFVKDNLSEKCMTSVKSASIKGFNELMKENLKSKHA